MNSLGKSNLKYCPICQIPLQAINISPTAHATQCLTSWDSSELEECPEGAKCLNTNIFHYRDYCHKELANYRSSSVYVEPDLQMFPIKKKTIKHSRRKRLKTEPTKSHAFLSPKKSLCSSERKKYCNSSDSDSDFFLPHKQDTRDLKCNSSDLSLNHSNKIEKLPINTDMNNHISDELQLCKREQPFSDSSELNALYSQMYSTYSESVDLFGDDETLILDNALKSETVVNSNCNATEFSNLTNNFPGIRNISLPVSHKTNIRESVSSDECLINHRKPHHISQPKCLMSNNEECFGSTSAKEQWNKLLDKMKSKKMSSDLKVDLDNDLSPASSSSFPKVGSKQCPFYKRIPGTPFAVDAFQYGDIPGVMAYFLSHFHSDHYIGLRKNFAHPIYCSQITANLVKLKIRVDKHWLNVLTLNQPQVICGVEVTALDANHCPGSFMLLFRLKNGCNYLHVGDFRAYPDMFLYPELKHIVINKLFLDNTYCNPRYKFPSQEEVIARVVTLVRKHTLKHPQLLVACGSYLIGKEKVFLGIAEALDWKIWADMDKRKVFECLNDPRINSRLTVDGSVAKVHVISMNHVNYKWLQKHAAQFKTFTSVIGIKPTGWELNVNSDDFKVDTNQNITIYGVPYSEHSSYAELRNFVRYILPEEIIPTVNVGNTVARNKMKTYFQEWMNSDDRKRQNTVSSYFK